MNKVVFIIPYFGELPHFLPIYFKGCTYNKNVVDVMFFTDCTKPKDIPENVIWNNYTISEFYDQLQKITGVNVSHFDSHKICDLKPFYGLLFADYIQSYDYWGYGDIDLVFGDLKLVFNDSFYEKYDAFTAHSVQAAGHFTVMRNNEKMNHLCINIKEYQKRIFDPFTTFMDEWDMGDLLRDSKELRVLRPQPLDKDLQNDFSLHNITYKHNAYIAYTQSKSTLTKWENGKCFYWYENRFVEVLYIHFMGLKHRYFWKNYNNYVPDSFYFSKIGYSPYPIKETSWSFQFKWQLINLRLKFRKSIGRLVELLISKTFKRRIVLFYKKLMHQ